MEVEFDVKMNAGILYDYMLHHTYTSVSGIVGTILGLLLLVLFFGGAGVLYLIFGVVVVCYLPWTLFLRSKTQMLNTPAFRETLHYRMTDAGLQVSQKDSLEMQEWDRMYKAVSTGRSIILYTSPVNASIFPRKQLGEQAADVIAMISTHMPPKKIKIRG